MTIKANPDPQSVAVVEDAFTRGVSPKAVLAFLYPLIGTVATALISWIVSGQFNASEIRVTAAGLVASLVAGLGAALGRTGTVVAPAAAVEFKKDQLPPNDALLAKGLNKS